MRTFLLAFLLVQFFACDYGKEWAQGEGEQASVRAWLEGEEGGDDGDSVVTAGPSEAVGGGGMAQNGGGEGARGRCQGDPQGSPFGLPCLVAPTTGDRSHGDPQPWKPSSGPQPY